MKCQCFDKVFLRKNKKNSLFEREKKLYKNFVIKKEINNNNKNKVLVFDTLDNIIGYLIFFPYKSFHISLNPLINY